MHGVRQSLHHALHLPRISFSAGPQQQPRARVASKWVATAAAQQRFYIVDMMPYVYKALLSTANTHTAAEDNHQQQFYAADGQPGKEGRQGATAQVVATILDLIRRKQDPPSHMAVVVDVPGPTFRHLKYPQYKAKRPQPPPELQHEVSCILSIVDAAGIPILAVPGVEADDVVGSLAARAAAEGFSVVVVSTDRDFYQLLQPNISMLRYPSGPLYTQRTFSEEFGLPEGSTNLWVDVKALAGDASDNIPGIRGVGLKTALQLVQQLGGVDNILHSFAAGQQPQQVKLRRPQIEVLSSSEGAAAARFAKDLVTIVTDLKHPPVRQPLDSFRLRLPPDEGQLAVERANALQLSWTAARLQDVFRDWQQSSERQQHSNWYKGG